MAIWIVFLVTAILIIPMIILGPAVAWAERQYRTVYRAVHDTIDRRIIQSNNHVRTTLRVFFFFF